MITKINNEKEKLMDTFIGDVPRGTPVVCKQFGLCIVSEVHPEHTKCSSKALINLLDGSYHIVVETHKVSLINAFVVHEPFHF
jgi:hypothetical protein